LRLDIGPFTELLGSSKQAYSKWIKGTYPGSDVLEKLAEQFPQYNAEWLLRGIGKMKDDGDKNNVTIVNEPTVKYGEKYITKVELKKILRKLIDELDAM
jgi:hypothetical protein